MRPRRTVRVLLVVAALGASTTWSARAVPPPVNVKLQNFRYCLTSTERCSATHQAYVADPTTGEPLVAQYNPQALIDVRRGAVVSFIYQDGPGGPTNPTACDSFNGGPVGTGLGVSQLYCPGHAVVLAKAGPGHVQKRIGNLTRERLGTKITFTVPSYANGTLIPFFCDVAGVHYRLGMTGAMRVVG